MTIVYLLYHVHDLPDGEEDDKLIGVYSSRASAQAAIERLSMMSGFSEHRSGFHIEAYELDKDHWEQGFVTM